MVFQFSDPNQTFATGDFVNWIDAMSIGNSGNVGIGCLDDFNNRLRVNGTISCKELKVTANGWCDYVFGVNYYLWDLYKLENYIKLNKHLPEIPTTEEVEKNGISVGEMQTKLLKKVEELTLYMIELKKENDALKERISSLEQQ